MSHCTLLLTHYKNNYTIWISKISENLFLLVIGVIIMLLTMMIDISCHNITFDSTESTR